jgi:hypothetical protein
LYFSCIQISLLACKSMLQAKREKSIYHTLNILSVDVTTKCLVGEGWSPVFAGSQVAMSLFPHDVFQLPS